MTDDHVCDPANPDCAAYLFYSNPENRRSDGPATRLGRVSMRLSSGALASMPRRFLGGQPLTANSAARRTRVQIQIAR